ncbi:hypothetical protein CYFUS_001711 [Cystobacter fuscus]|uniref:Uncharacterized protein n=1 Tax=Cystobacter fuscus TaxID=43 RepID=A0A250IYK8_9BACT|nr:hypothetical protein [Cystobacter fuscus]ATB36297.1 hypothetical protein CYFUS_001711 [Cystobacter fuscus]
MGLESVAEWLGKYWSAVVAVTAVAAGGTTALRNVLDIRRGRREDAAKRAAAQREDEHRQWTEAILEVLRARRENGWSGSMVEVKAGDREHLDWAVKNKRLRVVVQGRDGACSVDEAVP